MRPPSTRLGHSALAACAVLVLVLAGAWALGSRLETSTQVMKSAQLPVGLVAPSSNPLPAQHPVAMPGGAVSATLNESPLPAAFPPPPVNDPEMSSLRSRALVIPVLGTTAPQLSDTFTQARAGGVPHDALDIMAQRGTPVLAVEDGRVAKLFLSKAGGITLYQFDPDSRYAYYYAHLDRYADGLTEGANVRKGQVLGYVGSTGNASPDAPHLHFAIFRLEPERQWWRGTPLNPYLVWRDPKP